MNNVFQTDERLMFVMRFVRGGDMCTLLQKQKRFSESRAKFYAAIVSMALGHLHKQNFIYRDLKTENILLEEDGYLSLTDFGLSKQLNNDDETTNTFCGTPVYLAPEIVKGYGYTKRVDWWALGILTYEMVVGFPPFYTGNNNPTRMYELIKNGKVFFPDTKKHGITVSPECKDFINKCLTKTGADRLGSKNDVEEVLSHPWFKDLNMDDIRSKKVIPEFKPKLSDMTDISNFEKIKNEESVISYSGKIEIKLSEGLFDDF